MRWRWLPWVGSLLSMALLALKLGNYPGWGDPWELTVASWCLGVTHPPGYPTIVLLARALQLLPISPYLAASLVCVISTGIGAFIIARLTMTLSTTGKSGDESISAALMGTLAGIAYAISPLVLELSTVLEVYSPATTLMLGSLWCAVSYRANHESPNMRKLYLAALLLGLAIGAHLTAICIVPSLIIMFWGGSKGSRVAIVTFLFILGASTQLLQPIRGQMFLPLDWSHPATWSRWFFHISAAQYSGMWGLGNSLGEYFFKLGAAVWDTGLVWVIPLTIWGIWGLWRKDRVNATAMVAVWILVALLPAFYRIWDINTYYLPWAAISLVLGAKGAVDLLGRLRWRRGIAFGIAGVVFVLLLILWYIPFRTTGGATLPYARLLLSQLPINTLVFTYGHPSMVPEAMAATDGLRPDVIAISRSRIVDISYWGRMVRISRRELPAGEDISRAFAISEMRGEGRSPLARAAMVLAERGWQGMGTVAWTPGVDIEVSEYPREVELYAGFPVWLWGEKPQLDEGAIMNVLRVARGDERGAEIIAVELWMAMEWAVVKEDMELAERIRAFAMELDGDMEMTTRD